jgi:hypothetical protein
MPLTTHLIILISSASTASRNEEIRAQETPPDRRRILPIAGSEVTETPSARAIKFTRRSPVTLAILSDTSLPLYLSLLFSLQPSLSPELRKLPSIEAIWEPMD